MHLSNLVSPGTYGIHNVILCCQFHMLLDSVPINEHLAVKWTTTDSYIIVLQLDNGINLCLVIFDIDLVKELCTL